MLCVSYFAVVRRLAMEDGHQQSLIIFRPFRKKPGVNSVSVNIISHTYMIHEPITAFILLQCTLMLPILQCSKSLKLINLTEEELSKPFTLTKALSIHEPIT